jgi:hypothetical protein
MSSLFTMISDLEPEKDKLKKKVTFEKEPIEQTDSVQKPKLVITEHFEKEEKVVDKDYEGLENYLVLLCLLIISFHPSKFMLKYLSVFKEYDYIALSVLVVAIFYMVCMYNES